MKAACCFLTSLVFFYCAPAQLRIDSMLIQGVYRTFRFYEPSADTKNSALVFVLHGSGGDGNRMIKPAEKLQAIAPSEKIFLVYPDGYKRYWNECRKFANSEANKKDVDEQAFFRAMLRYFNQKYKVTGNRFFAIGMSGGGHMSYKLAVTMPDTCKAISVIVANLPDTMNFDCQESKKPVAVMITNSTADDVNPFDGGTMRINGSGWGEVRSSFRSFYYWAELAGYKGNPAKRALSDPDKRNNQSITRFTFRRQSKPEITLLQVNGGVHSFPLDIDIFLESWEFFKKEIKRKK